MSSPAARDAPPRWETSPPWQGLGAPADGAARSLRAARGSLPAEPLRRGAAALTRWTGAHAKDLEVVAQRRDADGPATDRALEVVAAFIRERGLVLFGGLAIDYALRLEGSRLYPDDERPDFDFLSPRSVDDAYDLADRLHAAGFEAVGVIRAIHVQTMRVRTNFIYVADIGYAPREVFDALPTVEYQGMRVLHPDFQRMDQLLAFCFPFNNPPHEDVFHRWRKDLTRFNVYEKFYPILPPSSPPEAGDINGATSAVPVVGRADSLTVAFHGFAAYAILRRAYSSLAAKFGAPDVDAPFVPFSVTSASTFEVKGPAILVSPAPDRVVAGNPQRLWYEPYMDLVPERVVAGGLTVYSTRGRLLGVAIIAAGDFVPEGVNLANSWLLTVTPQYLMLHFLAEAHLAENGDTRKLYRAYYVHVLALLRAAEEIIVRVLAAAEDDAQRAELVDIYMKSPFTPSTQMLGTVNHNAAYLIRMASSAKSLHEPPPPNYGLPADIASALDGLPQNYYPAGGKKRPDPYDYSASRWYRRAGQPREA